MPLPDWFLPSARALIRADSVSAVGNGAALEVLEPLYTRAGFAPVEAFGEYVGSELSVCMAMDLRQPR